MMVAPWHTKSQLQMRIALKAAFLENYLAVRAWILNSSLIECHEKKPFSLSGQCSIWMPGDSNFWVKIGLALNPLKMSFPPLSSSIMC